MVADNRLVVYAAQRDVQGENWILKYYGPLCVIRAVKSVPGIGSQSTCLAFLIDFTVVHLTYF
jgi:hypothetical protein